MKRENFELPTGLTDYLPEECFQKNKLEAALLGVFESYGFRRVETPVFEYYDRFAVPADEMFKFSDIDGNLLALRPDMTLPIARLSATKAGDGKFSYIANSYTLQNKINRDREFAQAGVETIGKKNIYADIELIAMAIEAFLKADLNDFCMFLRHAESEEELAEILEGLKKLGFSKFVAKDASAPKEKKYYTGVMFSGMSKLYGANLVGGGRYEIEGVEGAGFAIGIKRLLEVLKKTGKLEKMPPIEVVPGQGIESLIEAQKMRKAGKSAEVKFL